MVVEQDRIGAPRKCERNLSDLHDKGTSREARSPQVPIECRWNGTNGVPNRAWNVALVATDVNVKVLRSGFGVRC